MVKPVRAARESGQVSTHVETRRTPSGQVSDWLKADERFLQRGSTARYDQVMIPRRDLLAGASAALVLTACAATPAPAPVYKRPYSRQPWAVPRVSEEAVIREVVGHRPWRPPGFRVEREVIDRKTIIHNYGHGGGGISLGWGSSALALRELGDSPVGEVAVLGSGIMGLTTARLLQDAGWTVTVYTRDTWRHTTSNVSGGQWGPYSTHENHLVDEPYLQRLRWAAQVSHHAYANLVGPRYGIRFMEEYHFRRSRPENQTPDLFAHLYAYRGWLAPGEHPFGDWWASHVVTLQMNPSVLLNQLTEDVRIAGGRFVIRSFERLDEVLALSEPVVFNCTGLGAGALFGDEAIMPAKGQLVFIPPDPAVDYMTIGGGRGNLYMFPRQDVTLLGGTFKAGDWSRQPDPDETARIIGEHRKLFADVQTA